MSPGIFNPALLVVILVVAVCFRVLWVALRGGGPGSRGAACGKCGYLVVGVPTFVCPECGSDLRVVGMTTPALAARSRGSTAGAIIAWTVLMLPLALLGSAAANTITLMRSSRVVQSVFTSHTLVPRYAAGRGKDPALAYEAMVGFTGVVEGSRTVRSGTIEVTLARSGNTLSTLIMTLPEGRASVADASGTPVPIDPAVGDPVAEAYRVAGFDAEDPIRRAEMGDLAAALDAIQAAPNSMALPVLAAMGPRQTTGRTTPVSVPAWPAFASGSVFVAVYVVGVVFIARRRRELCAADAGP